MGGRAAKTMAYGHRLAPGRAWQRPDGFGEIDCFLARHIDALELHLVGGERLGRIHAHLGADAVAGRRIELGALAFRNDH